MSKDNVIPLGGTTSIDLPANQVIEQTLDKLESVVIIGYDKDGDEYFASSISDGADVMWLLERSKKKLMEIVEQGWEHET